MRKTILVAQREFMENMRTKTFWFGILAAPIGIVFFYALMFIIADKTDVRKYVVFDQSQSEDRGEKWLSKAVFKRAKSELLKTKAMAAIDRGMDEFLPVGRPLRELFDEERDNAKFKTFGKWFLSFGEEPLSALGKALLMQKRMKAGGEAMLDAENDPEKRKGLESKFEADAASVEDFGASIMDEMKSLMESAEIHKLFELVPYDPGAEEDVKKSIETLNEKLQEEEIFAYFIIGQDPLAKEHGSTYVSNNVTDRKLRKWFSGHSTEIIRDEHIKRLKKEKGLDSADVHAIKSVFTFEEQMVRDGEVEKVRGSDKALKYAPIAFVYILWMAVFIAAQMLLTNTVEEKSNRIIEVLLSSVSPSQLMNGKIYGIALTGLTVVGSWAMFLIVGVKLAPLIFPDSSAIIAEYGLDQIVSNPLYLISFLGYFLSGYLFYAAILVAIGSVCNSLKEAQNLMQPVILALMVPLATMFPIANDPNGTLAKVMTYIPIYTPFAMMNRAGGPPPAWEWIASSALILVSLWIAFRGAAKVFRIGVLMTGKPPKIREIIRWMRAPVR